MKLHALACLVVLTVVSVPCDGYAVPLAYDEVVLGDLSGDTADPTPLHFDIGVNDIRGGAGRSLAGPFDLDVFTFTVAPGQWLARISLTEFVPEGSFGTGSFVAIAAGSQIAHFDAETHLGDGLVAATGDLLPLLAEGGPYGAAGFEIPLGPGIYTFWIEEASTRLGYALEFVIVPEANTILLVASGIAGLACSGARRGRRRESVRGTGGVADAF